MSVGITQWQMAGMQEEDEINNAVKVSRSKRQAR